MAQNQVIIVGGGLAGLSAAHTVLEHGGSVTLVDKSPFCGGNSTKATSGINGAVTTAQLKLGTTDSLETFTDDCNTSFHGGKKGGPISPLIQTLTGESAPSLEWLMKKFKLDLSVVGYMGGHSKPRTHRGKEKFPGMTITYALLEALEAIAKAKPDQAKIINKARVTRLIKAQDGSVTGCVYEKAGQEVQLNGPVILACGGYGADFSEGSLLAKYRPELLKFATTNGVHCTGDGCKMAESIGAGLVDMDRVQVHPTGMVNPAEPDAKVKFLAAEALRGTGALVLNGKGERFCNELGRRDYVSNLMLKGVGPYRLVLNSKCAKEIHWHCKHYTGRGLMKQFKNGAELAKEMGVDVNTIQKTFAQYNEYASGAKKDPFGKTIYKNGPWDVQDSFYVAVITPLVHYTMGGVKINEIGECLSPNGEIINGLYAAGEVAGAVHGINRLGGNSLLDCVVYGRTTGRAVCKYLLQTYMGPGAKRLATIESQLAPTGGAAAATAAAGAPAAAAGGKKKFTKEEVAKHNKENDCWVIIGNLVLDTTKFLPDHPGGKKAILLFAGRDATEEFDMLHKREVIDKYAPECVIGELA